MSEEITYTRRRFLGGAAMTIVTAQRHRTEKKASPQSG
jgi:hypothetical protein